jgi:hypothetical protein
MYPKLLTGFFTPYDTRSGGAAAFIIRICGTPCCESLKNIILKKDRKDENTETTNFIYIETGIVLWWPERIGYWDCLIL